MSTFDSLEMTTIPFQAQYVIDAAGKRTHVIVPIECLDSLINQQQPFKESVFVDIEEAEQWLKEELSEDVNFEQDSLSHIQSHKTNAQADLSERLDDYLYGKHK
ncbi:MAG TPA: hypothetical protein VI704_01545 [Bacteroidota bacterium]|nr:hypothetical protein [Bacteroidota bacterium]